MRDEIQSWRRRGQQERAIASAQQGSESLIRKGHVQVNSLEVKCLTVPARVDEWKVR